MKHQHVEETKYCEECLIPDLLGYIPNNEHTKPLKKLLDFSMRTFARRARKYMIWYYVTKVISFVAPLVITAITTLGISNIKYYTVFLSLAASIAVGVAGLGLFHENWIRYRETFEHLKTELIRFVSDTGEYNAIFLEDAKVDLFSKKISGILESETQEWKKVASLEYFSKDAKDTFVQPKNDE